MAETWVFVVTDPDKMARFAAKALHAGWMRSCYRVNDRDRVTTDMRTKERPYRELFDQDANGTA